MYIIHVHVILCVCYSLFHVIRFHDAQNEPTLDCDVVLHLDDNTQLSVERYRDRVHASIARRRERMRMRREEEREEPDVATPTPAEATPTSDQVKRLQDTPKQPKNV